MKIKKTDFTELNELYYIHNRAEYPMMPEYARVRPSYSDKTTNKLTKCVIDYLKFQGFHVERTGNEGRIIDERKVFTDALGFQRQIGSIKRIKGSGTNGTSDLKACVKGRFVTIEIKCEATKDRQSEDQKKYENNVKKSGGFYLLARNFNQFSNDFKILVESIKD